MVQPQAAHIYQRVVKTTI